MPDIRNLIGSLEDIKNMPATNEMSRIRGDNKKYFIGENPGQSYYRGGSDISYVKLNKNYIKQLESNFNISKWDESRNGNLKESDYIGLSSEERLSLERLRAISHGWRGELENKINVDYENNVITDDEYQINRAHITTFYLNDENYYTHKKYNIAVNTKFDYYYLLAEIVAFQKKYYPKDIITDNVLNTFIKELKLTDFNEAKAYVAVYNDHAIYADAIDTNTPQGKDFQSQCMILKNELIKDIFMESAQNKDLKIKDCYGYRQLERQTNMLNVLTDPRYGSSSSDSDGSKETKLEALVNYENSSKKDFSGWDIFKRFIAPVIITGVGAVVGAVVGSVIGATLGGASSAWAGPGALVGISVGATAGAVKGATIGASIAAGIGGVAAGASSFLWFNQDSKIEKLTKEVSKTGGKYINLNQN